MTVPVNKLGPTREAQSSGFTPSPNLASINSRPLHCQRPSTSCARQRQFSLQKAKNEGDSHQEESHGLNGHGWLSCQSSLARAASSPAAMADLTVVSRQLHARSAEATLQDGKVLGRYCYGLGQRKGHHHQAK